MLSKQKRRLRTKYYPASTCSPRRVKAGVLSTKQSGQSLIELIVGIAVGVIFIVGAAGIIMVSLRVDFRNTFAQTAHEIAIELGEQVRVFANADWHNVDTLSTSTAYHLATSTTFLDDQSGSSTIVIDGNSYTRSFTLEPVYRDASGEITTPSGILDPSTLRVVSTASWTERGDQDSATVELYLTRNRNRLFHQTDWSGGPVQEGPITVVGDEFATSTNATTTGAVAGSIIIEGLSTGGGGGSNTNIDEINHWAWNDVTGWVDFFITGTVNVSSTKIEGYASSQIGFISFDCATTPIGNQCAGAPGGGFDWGVINDGAGNLSGYAWSDIVGWIGFCGGEGTTDCPGTASHQVTIDSATGFFHNFAWNDDIGWIAFNCEDTPDACGTADYRVETSFGVPPIVATLTSSIFDTERVDGAAFNTIMWQGNTNGGAVKFQIASSQDLNGPWSDSDYLGPDGTSATYYQPISGGVPIAIKREFHNNHRYVRYRVFLESDITLSRTPNVDDIIINWSL